MLARVACVAKVFDHSNLEMLSPKQMLQELPISLTQVKADNTSEKLLNEIGQTMYSLYWPKETTKKVYNNIMNSIELSKKMDTIFMNSKISETSDPHKILQIK